MAISSGEQQLERRVWIANAAQAKFGVCADYGRREDEAGRRLYVARAERCRKFRCFDCSTNPKRRRRSSGS